MNKKEKENIKKDGRVHVQNMQSYLNLFSHTVKSLCINIFEL